MSERPTRATPKEALTKKTAGFVIDRLVLPGQEGYEPLKSQRPDQQVPMVFFVDPAHPDKKPRTHRLRGEQAQDAFLEMMEESRSAPSEEQQESFARLEDAFKAGLDRGGQAGFASGQEQGRQWGAEEIARLTQELADAQQEADQFRAEFDQLRTQANNLESQVQTLTDQVQELRDAAAGNTQPDSPTPPDDPTDPPIAPVLPPVDPGTPAGPDIPPAPTDPDVPADPDVPPVINPNTPFDQGDEPQPRQGRIRRFFSRRRRQPAVILAEPLPLDPVDDSPVIVANQPVVPAEVVQPIETDRNRRGRAGVFIGGLAVGAAVAGIAVWDYMEHKHFGHNPSREIRQQFQDTFNISGAKSVKIFEGSGNGIAKLTQAGANHTHHHVAQVHHNANAHHHVATTEATLGYRGDTVWHEVSRRYKEHVAKVTGYVLKINHLRWQGGGRGVDAHDLPVGFHFKMPVKLPANLAHLFKK